MNLQWIENGEITHVYFMMLLFVIKYQISNQINFIYKVEISIAHNISSSELLNQLLHKKHIQV